MDGVWSDLHIKYTDGLGYTNGFRRFLTNVFFFTSQISPKSETKNSNYLNK
jgi:hypothetical protein